MTVAASASRTDVGKVREHNEDSVIEQDPLFAVADGVGGAAAGEVASGIAVDVLAAGLDEITAAGDFERAFDDVIDRINVSINEAQGDDPQRAGMATTLTAAIVRDGGEVVFGHVGDSRGYRINDTGIEQVTDDHSVVGELVRAGRMSAEEAARHPQRNVITRALGSEAGVEPDVFVVHARPGDWFLLCSDGLSDLVDSGELALAVREHPDDPATALERLVKQANARGGTDNISAVLFQPLEAPAGGTGSNAVVAAGADDFESPVDQDTGEIRIAEFLDRPAGAPGEGTEVGTPAVRRAPRPGSDRLDLEQMTPDSGRASSGKRRGDAPADGRRGVRRTLAVAVAATVVAALVAVIVWNQSYFLDDANGRVVIRKGFPAFGLNRVEERSDVRVGELSEFDRDQKVDDHTIRSRQDAEKVLAELDEATNAFGPQVDEAPADAPTSTGSAQ